MAVFKCKCGYEMAIKSEDETFKKFLVDSDFIINKLEDIVDVGIRKMSKDDFFDAFDKDLRKHSRRALVCPNCDRIWVSDTSDRSKYYPYIPE